MVVAKYVKYTTGEDGHLTGREALHFECPGCGGALHAPTVQREPGDLGPCWSWNGSVETPTLNPSLLISYTYQENKQFICHSFIRDGKIQYLPDCTHALAGQTVPLPEWE